MSFLSLLDDKIFNNLSRYFPSWVFVFLLSLLVVLPFQGSRPFQGRDEHRYPEIAQEMLKKGDFLLPRFKGHLHLAKPPLIYWAIILGYKIAGCNPWGARLPNALAFALTSDFVFLLGRELTDEKTGLRAALLYMSTLLPFVGANIVTPDTLLVSWETGALWAFIKAWNENSSGWRVIMWLFWALAFLTKGTAMLPIATGCFLFWGLERKNKRFNPFSLSGLIVFSLIALPWYLYVLYKVPGAFKIFWLEQVYGRLFSDTFHRNSAWYAPFYLYLPLLTFGALPGAWFWLKAWRSRGVKKISLKVLFEDWPNRFLIIEIFIPLLIFCVAKSRLPLYILPLFGPLSILTARYFPFGLGFWIPWIFLLITLKGLISYATFIF